MSDDVARWSRPVQPLDRAKPPGDESSGLVRYVRKPRTAEPPIPIPSHGAGEIETEFEPNRADDISTIRKSRIVAADEPIEVVGEVVEPEDEPEAPAPLRRVQAKIKAIQKRLAKGRGGRPLAKGLARVESTPIDLSLDRPRRADEHPAAVYLARLAPGSRPSIKSSIETIARELGSTPEELEWHKLRYQHALALRARFAKRYEPASANRLLAALRGVLKEAMRLGLMSNEDYAKTVDFEPVRGERVPKGRALKDEEIKRIFQTIDTSTLTGARDAAIFAVMYGAGARRREVTNLTLASYDREGKALKIHGKGNKERIVYLDQGVVNAIDHWLWRRDKKLRPTDPLFVPVDQWGTVYNRRLSDQSIMLRLREIAKNADVKAFDPHDLRRTFITHLIERGVDIRTVQQLAGHSQVTTTARYDRRGEEAKKKAIEVLNVPFQKTTIEQSQYL